MKSNALGFLLNDIVFLRFQAVLMSVVVGTLFNQVPPGPMWRAMDLRRSLSFMACSHMFVSSVGQIPAIIADRKVNKHKLTCSS